MNYLLAITLDGFYVKEHLGDHPLAVHRNKTILDVNGRADAEGVRRGMTLSEAKALARETRFVEWEEEAYRAAQERWLDRCAEIADVIEPLDQHRALLDLSAHRAPLDLAMRLLSELSGEGWIARGGIAPVRWVAELVGESAEILAEARDPRAWIEPLRISCLAPVSQEARDRLHFLGYRTIGEVRRIPMSVLQGQFGEEALAIQRAAQGRGESHVQSVYPRASLAHRVELDGPLDSEEALQNTLIEISRELGRRLRDADLAGKEAVLWLEDEDGHAERRHRIFSKPFSSEGSLFASLSLMLSRPPERPAWAVRVRLPKLDRLRQVQADFSGNAARSERIRSANGALAEVRAVYGDAIVALGAETIEPRRVKVLRSWKDASGWF